MTIGTPLTMGSNTAAASSTNVLTTITNTAPVARVVLLSVAYITVANTLTGVTDSVGNSWTVLDNVAGTGIALGIAYTFTTILIPVGATITATFSGANTSLLNCGRFGGANALPIDVHGPTQNGLAATAATTTSSGVLATNNELVIAMLANAVNPGTITHGAGWTASLGATGTPSNRWTTRLPAATTSLDYTPTWVNASNYVTYMASFKPASGSIFNLLGVGQ